MDAAEWTDRNYQRITNERDRLRLENDLLRQVIRDAIEAMERGSTATPVLEHLRASMGISELTESK